MAFACGQQLILAGKRKDAPTRMLLLNDGDIGWAGLEGVTLDQEQADAIIKHFEAQGAELVIDYHHASKAVEDGEAARAPAAGWITALAYVKGEGLYGTIRWNAKAAQEIEAEEFKYLSPVILTEQKTGEIGLLHSVALTNRPRTIDAPELLAADLSSIADRMQEKDGAPAKLSPAQGIKAIGDLVRKLKDAGIEIGEESTFQAALQSLVAMIMPPSGKLDRAAAHKLVDDLVAIAAEGHLSEAASLRSSSMKKHTKASAAKVRRPIGFVMVSAQDEVAPGLEIDTEALPDDQVKELDAVGAAVAMLAEALAEGGAEIPEGATTEDILAIAIDVVKGGTSEEETANPDRESIAAALNLKPDSDLKMILGALDVRSGQAKGVTERLVALEGELAERHKADDAKNAQDAIDGFIKQGKINPNNKPHLKRCLEMATADVEQFEMFMGSAEVVCPPDGRTVTPAGATAIARDTRSGVIAATHKEWTAMSADDRERHPIRGLIDTDLGAKRLKAITDDEFKALGD